MLSFQDLYGGKLHAALDRQHPRDLFDVKLLYENEGLTGDIAAFLLSVHDSRPAFDLIGFPEAARLPAVRWKLANVRRLIRENPEKHFVQRNALEDLFQ